MVVHNTPALNVESVAEFVLAATFSLARRIPEYDRSIRAGRKVVRSEMLGLSLYRKTVGVVGMGNIGRFVAKKFVGACESKIVAYDPDRAGGRLGRYPSCEPGDVGRGDGL